MKLGFIEKIGSIGAFVAAAACPACFPLLAIVGATLGLGVLSPFEGWVFVLFKSLVLVALAGNVLSFLHHRTLLGPVHTNERVGDQGKVDEEREDDIELIEAGEDSPVAL